MARFVQIAMGSGAELSYHLRLARDLGFLSAESFDSLRSNLSEVMRMLSCFLLKLKPKSTSALAKSQKLIAKS
jgi:four helix bundle protein